LVGVLTSPAPDCRSAKDPPLDFFRKLLVVPENWNKILIISGLSIEGHIFKPILREDISALRIKVAYHRWSWLKYQRDFSHGKTTDTLIIVLHFQ